MGNFAKLSRAGYLDIFAWRKQPLNSTNSTTRMSWNGVAFPLDTASSVVLEVFTQSNFQASAAILSFSTGSGTLVALNGGFYLSVAGATMDIAEDTYYYNLKADGELLLTGKFVIGEYGENG